MQTDFFVVSGDLVSNVFLHTLADIHRSKDAALTVMLKPTKNEPRRDAKKDDADAIDMHFFGKP